MLPVAATTALLVLGGLDLVNDRYELDPALDALLHDSADSYTAQRISYIQNMRARLQGGTDVEQLEDVYAGLLSRSPGAARCSGSRGRRAALALAPAGGGAARRPGRRRFVDDARRRS